MQRIQKPSFGLQQSSARVHGSLSLALSFDVAFSCTCDFHVEVCHHVQFLVVLYMCSLAVFQALLDQSAALGPSKVPKNQLCRNCIRCVSRHQVVALDFAVKSSPVYSEKNLNMTIHSHCTLCMHCNCFNHRILARRQIISACKLYQRLQANHFCCFIGA